MSTFDFIAPLWVWSGGGGTSWHFLTLPFDVTDDIDEICCETKKGFGSVRVNATIGRTSFTTSVFPSKEQKSFILPVKAQVRKAESLVVGTACAITLTLLDHPGPIPPGVVAGATGSSQTRTYEGGRPRL